MRLSLILFVIALLGLVFFGATQTVSSLDGSTSTADTNALTTEIETTRASFTAENETLVEKIASLEAASQSQTDALDAAIAEKAELQTTLDDVNTRLEGLTAENAALMADNDAAMQTLSAEKDALETQISQLEQTSAEYLERIAALESEIAVNATAPDEQLASLQALVTERTDALSAAEERIAGLTTDISTQEETFSAMADEVTNLNEEVAALSSALTERDDMIATLQTSSVSPVAGCQDRTDALLAGTSIGFENGTSTFAADTIPLLENLAAVASECVAANLALDIEGHTDNVGGLASNLLLSNARAKAVQDYLEAGGVPNAAIRSVGFGSSAPIADNGTTTGQLQNQRIVLYWKER